VVFILLLFFMVSTTFTKETHLSVDLPEAVGEASTETQEQLDVVISAQGHFSVNGHSLVNNKVETLKSALEKLSQGNTKLPLSITADANTPHQFVVTAMDAAGQMGFVHLSITSRQPDPVTE
jgi:biopolymer transport protein ExbD